MGLKDNLFKRLTKILNRRFNFARKIFLNRIFFGCKNINVLTKIVFAKLLNTLKSNLVEQRALENVNNDLNTKENKE